MEVGMSVSSSSYFGRSLPSQRHARTWPEHLSRHAKSAITEPMNEVRAVSDARVEPEHDDTARLAGFAGSLRALSSA
jgi:hypothetical protein